MEMMHERPASAGPLAGVRVVEIGAIGPAPYACMILSDLGARVTRVDRLDPDPLSGAGDPRYDFLLRGRERIALDLKSERGRDIVLRLVDGADVLIEGFRPGVAEKLGIGPDVCFTRNQRLVYGRMTGWGQTGPLASSAGHDINYIALSGALHAIGTQGGPPVVPLNLIGDFGGGAVFLVVGVLAALLEARRSGKGQVVDAAMVDGAVGLMSAIFAAFASGFWRDERGSNLLDGGAPFYAVYETADGKHVALGAIEPKFFAELVARIGIDPAWAIAQYDSARWPELRSTLTATFRRRSRDEWCKILEGTDACFAPVLSLGEASSHAHLKARGTFTPVAGIDQPAPAPRFSRTPSAMPRPGVGVGFDSAAILARLGYGEAEVAALRAAGVIRKTE
jgi:alpha-methylacyl-CoA racemase